MSDAQAGSTTSRYEVLAKLSQGSGTAELFAARAAGGERLVVIKRLRREAAKEKAVAQAFLAEARVAAKLAHPNVAQVFEVGKLGGAYFFTTEYVDGETIRALVTHARGKKIQVPIRAFLTIAAGAASGLHHAHERNGMDGKSLNIIHGDISPTNVMISREGIVKVLDFGMSRGRNPTRLAYASPEQLRGEKLDRRSDLFSLGVVLWELLTLGELFQRDTDDVTRNAVENDEAPAPSLRRFDVPPELDAILIKLLAKKPDARFQTGGELLAAIDSLSTKLGFSLSTNDLARMMRLWFGPPTAPSEADELKPIEVASEDILAEAPAGAHPVDEQLATLSEAATTIRAMAQRMGGAARADRPPTTPPSVGEVEDARENFAQIRDRILEQARKRKTTKAPPLSGQADTPPSGVPAAIAAADSGAAPTRKKPETLNAANNAYAFITKVAETATAPQAKATLADAGMALKALHAASAHAEADGANGSNGNATGGHRAVTATYDAAAAAAAAEEVAKAAERAEAALAASEPAASTEPTKAAEGTIEAKGSSESSAEAAPVAKIELSKSAAADAKTADSDAKTEAKAEKADAKAEAKAEKADAKAEKAEAKADAKVEKAEAKKAANDEKAPSKTTKTNGVAARASSSEEAKSSAKRAARSPSEARDDDAPAGRPSWLMPALLVVAAAVILIFVMKGRSHETKKPDQVAQTQGGQGAGAGAGTTNAGTGSAVAVNTGNTGSAVAMTGSDNAAMGSGAMTGSAGSATTMVTPVDAAVAVTPVDAAVVAEAKPDAAVVATNTGTKTNTGTDTTGTGTKTNTGTGTKTNTGTTGTGTKTNTGTTGTGTKTNTGTTGTKTNEPAAEETIEDLFAKGDYAKTNKACVKNLIFSPERLQDCALAACHATNVALAKRWVNAIAKAARPDVIAQCKTLGVDLETPPPAP